MPGVILEISPQVAAVLAGDAGREIQKMAALKLYECRRMSVELAADLAGVSLAEFTAMRRESMVPAAETTASGLGDELLASTPGLDQCSAEQVIKRMRQTEWRGPSATELMNQTRAEV